MADLGCGSVGGSTENNIQEHSFSNSLVSNEHPETRARNLKTTKYNDVFERNSKLSDAQEATTREDGFAQLEMSSEKQLVPLRWMVSNHIEHCGSLDLRQHHDLLFARGASICDSDWEQC